MTNRHIVDRKLPQRTYLKFYFPQPSEGNNYFTVRLPFFENSRIREMKKARYKKYSLVSRSSNLYSYLGADSRVFDLTFNISLPHLLQEHPEIKRDTYVQYEAGKDNTEAEKQRFKEPNKSKNVRKGMALKLGNQYTQEYAQDSARQVINNLTASGAASVNPETLSYLKYRYGIGQEELTAQIAEKKTSTEKAKLFKAAAPELFQSVNSDFAKARAIDIIIYWVNIIRASLVNNANNPIYGPPVIRLNHGIMYQNIPCICTNYNIEFNEAAGYDMDTLLPRQIKVNMKLEEFRTGNFGEFVGRAEGIVKDNLAGWEAVVLGDTNSMDPGYVDKEN